jgi:hypothetical protein
MIALLLWLFPQKPIKRDYHSFDKLNSRELKELSSEYEEL